MRWLATWSARCTHCWRRAQQQALEVTSSKVRCWMRVHAERLPVSLLPVLLLLLLPWVVLLPWALTSCLCASMPSPAPEARKKMHLTI